MDQTYTIGPPAGVLPSPNYLSKYGIVGWWLLNEGGGTVVKNVGRYGSTNNGSLTNNATWVRSPFGSAILCDNTNSYFGLSTTTFLTAGAPFSVSWWEKITSSTAGRFPARFVLNMNGSSSKFIALRSTSDATYTPLCFGLSPGSASSKSSTQPSTASGVGIWRHYVITGTDPSTNGYTTNSLYVNGVSYALSAGPAFGSAAIFNTVGWDGADHGSDAAFSDFRVYNRILTSQEVNDLYLFPFKAFSMPLVFLSIPGALKTYHGLSRGSIKTMNAVAIASVKTINGLA